MNWRPSIRWSSLPILLLICPVALALEPHEIALVVNRNVPESVELAKFYAAARDVPSGRIIQLDLPAASDEIPFDDYDRLVAQPVRQFLQANQLQQQVKCLVTFYGVPLRVAKRATTAQETAELERVKAELQRLQRGLDKGVFVLERMAVALDPAFKGVQVASADALARRADHATRTITAGLSRVPEAQRRAQLQVQVDKVTKFLSTPVGDPPPSTGPATGPSTAPAEEAQAQGVDPQQLAQLLQRPDDPAARAGVRVIARRTAHPFAYEKVLQEHAVYLTTEHTDSAMDSELALVWLPQYPRAGWQPNPLGYPFLAQPNRPQAVMVMRLDAPKAEQVRQMIETSLAVEREGLRGKIVIDTRGIGARKPSGEADAFGTFDQRLRELASLVKRQTKLELVLDEKPDVIPPPPQQPKIDAVALYCGWYSVGQYVPSMTFARGAVGYHIASYELTSLRDETNTGWGRGLINDGVVATMGPVAEPLLHAFPAPDDFFPLLLTGKLSLAEVYWRTCPLVSWKMCAVGDPLYTPYKNNPALSVEQLPERLRVVFSDAEAAPATAPTDALRERSR